MMIREQLWQAAEMLDRLLDLGLTVTFAKGETAFWAATVTGGKADATGEGRSIAEALIRAGWRWTQDLAVSA
jgi:hypothetical protein